MNNLKYEYGNFPNESFISRESLKLNSLRSSVLSAKSMHKHKLPVTGGPYSLFSLKLWWTRWIGIDTPALCLVWLASCCSSRSPSSTHASQCRWRTDCTKKPSFFGFIRLKRETRLMYPGLGDVMRCDVDPLVVSIAGRHSLYHFLSRQVSILITSGHRSIQNTKKVIFPKIGHKRFLFGGRVAENRVSAAVPLLPRKRCQYEERAPKFLFFLEIVWNSWILNAWFEVFNFH